MVEVTMLGATYAVPAGLTMLQAIEYAGIQLVHGVGCRGGVCGACATLYRIPGDAQTRVALACQTVVEPGMHLLQVPYFPNLKTAYDISAMAPTAESIVAAYPEVMACVGCNTCTKMCPKELPVMDFISGVLRGDLPEVAHLSFECVMCGLCVVRCPGNISPNLLAMQARRLVGRHLTPLAPDVETRIAEINGGMYEHDLDRLVAAGPEELEQEYLAFQKPKGPGGLE